MNVERTRREFGEGYFSEVIQITTDDGFVLVDGYQFLPEDSPETTTEKYAQFDAVF